MSFSEFQWESLPVPTVVPATKSEPESTTSTVDVQAEPSLNRIREVRREQGVTIKRAAQLMRKPVEELRAEEDPTSDLTLSQVYEWQRLLEVPVADLLVEPHAPLSAPVLRRAQLLRMMKTVQAIMERSTQAAVRRLCQTMANQLIEIMPELEGVTPWNSLDHRSQNQNCRLLEQAYSNLESDASPTNAMGSCTADAQAEEEDDGDEFGDDD